MNYDAPDDRWPAALKTAFEQYVTGGGGLVVVHAADNAFAGWPAFNEMIGSAPGAAAPRRRGRSGTSRTASSCPTRRRARRAVTQRVPFAVTVRDASHPITRGLPAVWMHQGDELYARLRGPGKNMTVLATALSPTDNAGTGTTSRC